MLPGEKNIKAKEKKSKSQRGRSQREVTAQIIDVNADIREKIDVETFTSKEEALQVHYTE